MMMNKEMEGAKKMMAVLKELVLLSIGLSNHQRTLKEVKT